MVPSKEVLLENHAWYHRDPLLPFSVESHQFYSIQHSCLKFPQPEMSSVSIIVLFKDQSQYRVLLLLNLNWIFFPFTFDMMIRHPLTRTWVSPLVSSRPLLSYLLIAFCWHIYSLVCFGPSTMNAVIQKGLHRTINLCDLCIGLYVHFIGFLERSVTLRRVRKWCRADDSEDKSTGYESMRTEFRLPVAT